MAKRRRSKHAPQAKHPSKKQHSQFDKSDRLRIPNPERRSTVAAFVPLVGTMLAMVVELSKHVDSRIRFRFPIIIAGMLFSDGRRTASAWFVAARVRDDWDRFYDFLIHVGRNSKSISWSLVIIVIKRLKLQETTCLRIAIDDSPTKRFGKQVQGAGVHHNPTPGPADGEWIYGHNWVTLALTVTHPLRGVTALPLRSLMYVRLQDVSKINKKNDWKFRTKHELAAELVSWFVSTARVLCKTAPIQLVIDGAYVSKVLFRGVMQKGVTIISRLRRDAALFELPEPRKNGQRGRPSKYGKQKISLAKRAGHHGGWQNVSYRARGSTVTRQCKTFLATSPIVGGVLRVVIVRYEDGNWATYISTDQNLDLKEILEAVADRWSIEECFHDLKEVWGAGEQQVRNIWSSIGCWHMIGWVHTLVQLASWNRPTEELVDRSDRKWDNPDRRPSTTDQIKTITKEMLSDQLKLVLPNEPQHIKMRHRATELFLWLCA